MQTDGVLGSRSLVSRPPTLPAMLPESCLDGEA